MNFLIMITRSFYVWKDVDVATSEMACPLIQSISILHTSSLVKKATNQVYKINYNFSSIPLGMNWEN